MKRRFCITSDWHVANFPNLGIAGPDMLTPQAHHIASAVDELRTYMKENGIDTLIHGGDVFHERNIRPDSINNLVDRMFADFVEDGIDVFAIHGNHDQANISGKVHALKRLLTTGVIVVSYPSILHILGLEFVFVPFMEHREALKKLQELESEMSDLPRIFVGHLGIDGSVVGSFEKKVMEPISLHELNPDNYIAGFLGHYHKIQDLGSNFIYTGAIVQHNYGDSGQERGFWDVEVVHKGNSWTVEKKFVPIESSPKFYTVSVEDFKKEDYRDIDYVKITGVSSEQRQNLLGELPNLSFEGEGIDIPEDEIAFSLNDDWSVWVNTYVDEVEENARRRRRLKKLGKEILNEVGE